MSYVLGHKRFPQQKMHASPEASASLRAITATLLFTGALLFTAPVAAQGLELFWTQTGGGRYDDWAHIDLDGDGNVVVTGAISYPARFAGSEPPAASGNLQDILLAKLGPDGSLVWANSSGGTLMDAGNAVVVNSGGQILVGGFFRDPFDFFGGPGVSSVGHREVFTALFESDGSLAWVKRGGGLERDASGGVAFDRTGNPLHTGQLRAGGDYDGVLASASFGGSGFVVRHRLSDGAVQSLDTYADSGVWAIETAPGGDYVIAGEFSGWTDFGTGRPASRSGVVDAFVARYDATGGLRWLNSFGGGERLGLDAAYGVTVAESGRVYVTGQFKGDMTLRPGLILSSAPAEGDRTEYGDGFVLCLEPDGSVCWARRFGGPGADLGIDITLPGDGSVAVAGAVARDAQFGTRTVPGAGSSDGFVARFDMSTGADLSLLTVGGAGTDGIEDVVADGAGDLYISGYFSDTVRFGDTSHTATERDLFVAKVIVADDVPEDPFEDDDTPATAAGITTPWTHFHRCPAWLARLSGSDDDTCEGIFANGMETLPDGSRRAPPRGAEQVWSMTVSGRSLTHDADFFRVDIPDPGDSRWGPDNENIGAGSPPGIDEPLPECGHTVRESIGPAGRNNEVNINMTGTFRISIVPAEEHEATGRGVRTDEPIVVYRDGRMAPDLFSRDMDVVSVTCPRTLHDLRDIVFAIGDSAPRSDFEMGEYGVQLEYVVEIMRGVPDWAFDPSRFHHRGFLPGFSSPEPGGRIDVMRNFPAIRELLENCVADGPGCWELFTVAWPGDEEPFAVDILAAPGMRFQLLDEQQNVVAEAVSSNTVAHTAQPGFAPQSLIAEQLPAGTYYLAAGGTAGNYALSYDSVGPMRPAASEAQEEWNQLWLLLILAIVAIAVVVTRIRHR